MDRTREKKGRIERFVKNRYTYLFTSILAIFIVHPLIGSENITLSVFFMLMMLAVLWTLDLKRGFFMLFLFLACISFLCSIFSVVCDALSNPSLDFWLMIADVVTYIIFLLAAILVLLKHIFSEKKITKRTILGGISVYFLMGIFWGFCYQLVYIISSNSILFDEATSPQYFDFMFFSFTTLTTLGYGDIVPISYGAKSLAMLEATLGPIFLAVYIARLVGLHISQSRD